MRVPYLLRHLLAVLAAGVVPPEWSNREGLWRMKNWLLRLSGIKIGRGAVLSYGFTSVPGAEDRLEVGAYASMASQGKIINLAPVRIGAFTTIAADVTLAAAGPGVPPSPCTGRGMTIGRGCWIGNGACLVGEITVGDHAVIGAGAYVMEDVPARAIAVGVPARVIKIRQLPERVWFSREFLLDTKTFQLCPHPEIP